MTDAERMAKWRAKHERRLARKAQYTPRPPTMDELMELMTAPGDFCGWKLDD